MKLHTQGAVWFLCST